MTATLGDSPPITLLDRGDRAHQGSDEVVRWCPACLENAVPMRNGACGFCDTPLILVGDLDELPLPAQERFDESALVDEDRLPVEPRVPRRRERRHNHGRPYTDEQIIARIQLWAEITGKPPSKRDWTPTRLRSQALKTRENIEALIGLVTLYELGDFPSESTVRDRFGSLNAALVQAGFEPRTVGREPTTRVTSAPSKPRTGPQALEDYLAAVVAARERNDQAALKRALWDLAMSAITEADRLPGEATGA